MFQVDRHVDHTHASPSYYEHVHQTLTYPLTNPAHAHTRPTVFTDLSVTITVRLTGFETVTGTTRTSTCYWDTATLTECVVFRGITEGVHRRRRAVEPSAVQEKSVPFYRRPDRVVTNVFFLCFWFSGWKRRQRRRHWRKSPKSSCGRRWRREYIPCA